MTQISEPRRTQRRLVLAFAVTWVSSGTASAQSRVPDSVLTLSALLSSATSQHPLLDEAIARVATARGARRAAGALPNPMLNYWVENARFPGQSPGVARDRETQTYVTLPLESIFQRWPRVRSSQADLDAATADLARARQLVALDAARAFFRVAAAQVAVEATRDVRARLLDLVAFTGARVREGKAAEADLIRTQVELDRAEATLALDEVELTRGHVALAPYMGASVAQDARSASQRRVVIEAVADTGFRPLPPIDELLTMSRTTRPDLVSARAHVAATRANVTLERTLAARQVGATFGTKQTLGVTSMIAGLSFTVPLFDQNRGEIQRATALRQAADAELRWAERAATAEVRGAYDNATALSARTAKLRGAMLERAEESERITLSAYREGAASLLQVLDAARMLADTRQMYYRLLFAQRTSMLELRAALGATDLTAAPNFALPTAPPSARTARPTGARQ